MKVALLTNIISPHRIPLSVELASIVGAENYRYYYTEPLHAERAKMGWGGDAKYKWCVPFDKGESDVESVDVLVSGHRVWDIFERRASKGLMSIYTSERWFKPPLGASRLLSTSYFKMAFRFVRMLSQAKHVYYFPQGFHAARDMARLSGLIHGDLKCLFKAPELDFERSPGGKVWLKEGGDGKRYCLDKMRMWGYFVEKGTGRREQGSGGLRVLWVGRLLRLKRVDTIIKAVGALSEKQKFTLDVYGAGPEEKHLKRLAAKYGDVVKFYPPVPISEVRKLMREHDVYVLSSNAYEGWGAVVSEALEEGMKVIGTYEAGSCATILPESNLFHAGDWRGLLKLLPKEVPSVCVGKWSAKEAAMQIFNFCKKEVDMGL